MTPQSNPQTTVTAWMRRRPYLVEAVSAVLGCGLGTSLCGGLGFWLIGWQAGIELAVIGAVVGLVVGFYSGQLVMAAVALLLMIFFPSRRIYLVIAGVVGAVGGFVRWQQLGESSMESLVAAIVYAILALIVCETCGAISTFFRRGNVRTERQSEAKQV